MSSFDTEKFIQPPDPDLICCICQCVLQTPVESPCRHVFCNVCITTWLGNHHNCPTCRTRVKRRHLKPVLPIVQNMINRLLMYCEFKDNGCNEKIMLELYLSHINSCGFKKIACQFTRCGKMILKKDKEQHENNDCEFREKLCNQRCGLMIPVCVYDTHDCYDELKRDSKEKTEMVNLLQEKIQNLQAQAVKLQKDVDRLKEKIARRTWNFPYGWDSSVGMSDDDDSNGSYYNHVWDSYSDDQDSNYQPYTPHTVVDITYAPPTSSITTSAGTANNGGFREYVIYPSRRATTTATTISSTNPVIDSAWPRYETRSTRRVYDIRSPSPPPRTTTTQATDQALDLRQQTQNVLLRVGASGRYELNRDQERTYPTPPSVLTVTSTGVVGPSVTVDNVESYNGVTSEPEEEDSNQSDASDSHTVQSDHSVYSVSESESEHNHTRWWRSSRSSLSHHSNGHRSSQSRSRSRSRSQTPHSRRSWSRSSSYHSDYSYYGHQSGSESDYSYDRHRRSRSLSTFSRSDTYYRDRSPVFSRRSRSSSRSFLSRRGWSRSSQDRSRSRSPLEDRSRSRSFDRESSRSYDSFRSGRSYRSHRRDRSWSSDSYSSDTPTIETDEEERTMTEQNSSRNEQGSSSQTERDPNVNSEHLNTSTSDMERVSTADSERQTDRHETDSDNGYNFKRRKPRNRTSQSEDDVESRNSESRNEDRNLSENEESGNEVENHSENEDPGQNQSSNSEHETSEGNRQRKRKHSPDRGSDDSKRQCEEEEDSDTSWVPSPDDVHSDNTITDEGSSSDSSYEVQVPKTVMEMIDEIDSDETDQTWSPN